MALIQLPSGNHIHFIAKAYYESSVKLYASFGEEQPFWIKVASFPPEIEQELEDLEVLTGQEHIAVLRKGAYNIKPYEGDWDLNAALKHLRDHGKRDHSIGYCAHYVCNAIDAGRVQDPFTKKYKIPCIHRVESAKDFNDCLINFGFYRVQGITAANFNIQNIKAGDVALIYGYHVRDEYFPNTKYIFLHSDLGQALWDHDKEKRGNHPHGHLAMFDGTIWISDFSQKNTLEGINLPYPGDGYRRAKPDFFIYRHSEAGNVTPKPDKEEFIEYHAIA